MDIFSYNGLNNLYKRTRQRNLALEWEEGAAVSELSTSGALNRPRRLWLLPLILMFFVLALFGRLVWFQIYQGSRFKAMADNNRIRERPVLAPRGLIIDSFGEVLANNTARFRLSVYPSDFPPGELEAISQKLSLLTGRSSQEIQGILDERAGKSLDPVVLIDNLPDEQRVSIATQITDLPGVSLEAIPTRDYVSPFVFSHALGFTGTIGEQDLSELLKKGYSSQDVVGKSGVELSYESFLKGLNGSRRQEVDARGKVTADLGEIQSEVGNTLELELDAGLQKRLYDSLSARGALGAAVALDPRDGAVRALVSLPGFDTNELSKGLDHESGEKLFNDPKRALFNRTISGTYPPGSIVKPMVATAALQEGVISDNTTITDKGYLSIANRYNPSIIYNFYGWKRDGLGPLNVYRAVARSSDIFFYVVGGGHPSHPGIEGLGVDRLSSYFRKFGLGRKLGIDLPGEASGLVPDREWKAKHFEGDNVMQKWYLGDTYHLSIGQGDLLVTPLQAAMWTSVIAGSGQGFKPRVLKQVKDLSGRTIFATKPEMTIDTKISEENIKIAQQTMRETVLAGSASPLLSLPVTSAGKTGTSQFDGADPSRTHAWFVAYAPFENPQIALAILVEAGGEGHAAALPAAKEALEWWARERYCKQEGMECKM